MSNEDWLKKITANGITADDLEKEYDRGYRAGWKDASTAAIEACYAALMLAANESFGFGAKRGVRLLQKVDEIITHSIDREDEITKVLEKFKVQLVWNDPIQRVHGREDIE